MEYRDTAKDFLGVGWQFPVGVDAATGRIRGASSEEDIRQSVGLILMTGRGERMMEPEFGCNVREYLFGTMDYTTRTELEQEVRQALVRWEPRITDIDVRVEESGAETESLRIHVSYVVRATNNPYNLVYPYYLSEGAES